MTAGRTRRLDGDAGLVDSRAIVKTMPGKMTPDFKGRSGRVTFSFVIAKPFQVSRIHLND
jgi:hypothetical protein